MFYTIQDNMPNLNKLILGTSSFWILNLNYYSYVKELYFQCLLLSTISIISPLFWYDYKINSFYHKLDNLLCVLTLLYVIYNKSSLISIYNILLMFYFYYTSIIFTIYRKYYLQLYSHLLFRLYFYKIIFLSINQDQYHILNYDIKKYILNNIILILLTKNDYNLVKYIKYSLEIIIVLFI